jgi:hypothetical protein
MKCSNFLMDSMDVRAVGRMFFPAVLNKSPHDVIQAQFRSTAQGPRRTQILNGNSNGDGGFGESRKWWFTRESLQKTFIQRQSESFVSLGHTSMQTQANA